MKPQRKGGRYKANRSPRRFNLQGLFKLVKPISDYLYGYELIAPIVIVNALTINLKLGRDEATNSMLLICPKGHGKTTLLYHILQKSNPQWFPRLPDKLFESEILKESDEIFRRKVWVQDDLVTTFRGTSTKQREQLMGFHNAFLTKGEYGRKGRTVQGRIVCIYGIASEAYKKRYAKEMFHSTFRDRFMPIRYRFDKAMEMELLKAKRKNKGKTPPHVELPFKEQPIDVRIPKCFEVEIDKMALELSDKGIMTVVRAQTYIQNFIRSCAVINGRNVVCEDDMRILRLVWPLHSKVNLGGVNLGSADMRVRRMIFKASIKGQTLTGHEIKDRMKAKGFSKSAVEKVLSNLRNTRAVSYRKVSGSGLKSYDHEYWI